MPKADSDHTLILPLDKMIGPLALETARALMARGASPAAAAAQACPGAWREYEPWVKAKLAAANA